MAARTKTKVTQKYKTKYRVKNWAMYDVALRERGDITVWFDEEAIGAWNSPPSGRPGGQRRYSDLAIVTALTLRTVFHLPLRQTEGFIASLIGLMGPSLKAPDHTTLSRRNRDVEIPRLARGHDGPLHLVIDSTGLIYRYKRIIGDCLRALHCEAQKREALIAVNVINRMSALGMPESVKVVA